MTEAAQKISLNFRRVTTATIAGMTDATLGAAATKPFNPGAIWEMPETPDELKQEINRTRAFLNDRDYNVRMVETYDAHEKLEIKGARVGEEIEEIKKKFSITGVFGRRKELAPREAEIRKINAETARLKAEHEKMCNARDVATKRLEQMGDKLDMLEGRPPKPKKLRSFQL